jgi:hypothetical protein
MRPNRLIPAIAAVAALGAAAPAQADVDCSIEVPNTQKLSVALKRGITSKVTCDGPARVLTPLDWTGTKQHREWSEEVGWHVSGISTGPPTRVPAAGVTVTARQYLTPDAARIARRYRRTRLTVMLAIEQDDKRNQFEVGGRDDLARIALVR